MYSDEAERYLGLIEYIIDKLRVYDQVRDEAYSEGLVILAEALASYDPSAGVPLTGYVAQRLRWGLMQWMRALRTEYSLDALPYLPAATPRAYSLAQAASARATLEVVFATCATELDEYERYVVLSRAGGTLPADIALALSLTVSQCAAILTAARRKLRRAVDDASVPLKQNTAFSPEFQPEG